MSAPETRIVVFGTGDFAVPTFDLLCRQGFRVIALVTQPDRPQGRKQELIPSLIKVAATDRRIPVLQPEDVNAPPSLAQISLFHPDLFVTAAYGQILSAELLAIPPLGGVNLHGSILPSYRGAAPVARAIQRGESESGVTVIRMTPRIDAGGMISFARTPIDPEETAGELEGRLAHMGAPLIAEAIHHLVSGEVSPIPQEKARITRAPKLRKEDGVIDWSLPANSIHNLIRAMNPWPMASTHWRQTGTSRDPLRLIVHRGRTAEGAGTPGEVLDAGPGRLIVAGAEGSVELLTVQVPGKKPLPSAEFLRGYRVQPGDHMGSATS